MEIVCESIFRSSPKIPEKIVSKMEEKFLVNMFCFSIIVANIQLSYAELVVNVKTRSGQYTQQYLMADPEKDIVMIDFTMPNGAKTTTLIDFSKVLI
jgi:hypothetical protein